MVCPVYKLSKWILPFLSVVVAGFRNRAFGSSSADDDDVIFLSCLEISSNNLLSRVLAGGVV